MLRLFITPFVAPAQSNGSDRVRVNAFASIADVPQEMGQLVVMNREVCIVDALADDLICTIIKPLPKRPHDYH